MTGEVFAVMRAHSILGRLMLSAGFDDAAFNRGVKAGLDLAPTSGGLLHRLFSVRTLGLVGELAEAALESYLSGLLIGSEIREALLTAGSDRIDLVLVGSSDLVARYDRALSVAGLTVTRAAPQAAARGQYLLAQLASLRQAEKALKERRRSGEEVALTAEEKEALRALGYVQ